MKFRGKINQKTMQNKNKNKKQLKALGLNST